MCTDANNSSKLRSVDWPSRPVLQKLHGYARLIHETNHELNLTAIRSQDEIFNRLIVDSSRLEPFFHHEFQHVIDEGMFPQIIDIGSGAGIPGIPLAISQPGWQFTLVEGTAKKARFIDQAITELAIENVDVIADRSETLAHDPGFRERFDLATARAVGGLSVLLELCLPFLKIKGSMIVPKGPSVIDELEAANVAARILGGSVKSTHMLPTEHGLPETVVVIADKLEATPGRFPRRPGIPAHQPLGR